MLMVSELGDALYEVFGEHGIDLFIFMNCWMHSIETACELQETVKILIAPETTIDFQGYDYKGLIDAIVDDSEDGKDFTDEEMEELAKKMIKLTIDKYSKNIC
jgi:hypothetical protein